MPSNHCLIVDDDWRITDVDRLINSIAAVEATALVVLALFLLFLREINAASH